MTRLLAIAFALFAVSTAQAQQKTTSAIKTDITNLFPSNGAGAITANQLRQVTNEIADSYANKGGDTFTGPVTIPFTQSGTGALARTVDAWVKDRVVSVSDFCSTAQIATDISTCAQAAIDSLAPANISYGGGKVYFPSRLSPYKLTGTLNLGTSYIGLIGDGPQATTINCQNGSADCVVIGHASNSTRGQSVESLMINGVSKSGGSSLKVQGNTYNTRAEHVQIENCIRCVDVGPGTNTTTIRDAILIPNQASSDYGVYWHAAGDGTSRSDVLVLDNVTVDGQWSVATGIMWDGLANTMEASHVRVIHATYGLRIVNSAASGTYYPQFLNAVDLELEGFKTRALSIEGGQEFKIVGSDISNLSGDPSQGSADDHAIWIKPDTGHSITRGVQISASRIGGSRTNGIFNEGRDVQISNVQFFSTSASGSGAAAVIRAGTAVNDMLITNIRCEENGGLSRASYCLQVDAGSYGVQASNVNSRYVVTGAINDLGGNQTLFSNIMEPAGATWTRQQLQVRTAAQVLAITCNAASEGTLYSVTDANSATFNAAIASGGANHVMAYCNGTGWTVH